MLNMYQIMNMEISVRQLSPNHNRTFTLLIHMQIENMHNVKTNVHLPSSWVWKWWNMKIETYLYFKLIHDFVVTMEPNLDCLWSE